MHIIMTLHDEHYTIRHANSGPAATIVGFSTWKFVAESGSMWDCLGTSFYKHVLRHLDTHEFRQTKLRSAGDQRPIGRIEFASFAV